MWLFKIHHILSQHTFPIKKNQQYEYNNSNADYV